MKDEDPDVSFSRQDLYEDYRSCYLRPGAEVRPCRDPGLLRRTARFLLTNPDPTGTFTAFPFHQALTERCGDATDSRKHLAAFVKAAEMLETICVNMFLQPWKKEIRSLKAFTGAFVYYLLPVLSRPTIQSVLACIGYQPNSDASQCEFTLTTDADADRALLLGFELLLAKVECYHLLELLVDNQLGPQEWLDVLHKRKPPTRLVHPTEKQMEPEQRKDDDEEKKELDKKQEPLLLETRSTATPPPKPRSYHLKSVDQSVMELQRTYPDLAFRGRPLLPDQPQKAHLAVTPGVADGTAALSKTNPTTEVCKAASPVLCRGDYGCNGPNGTEVTAPAETSGNVDESRADEDDDNLSSPQAISLHITLRKGAKAESSMRRGKIPPTAASSDYAHQKPGRYNVMADKAESPSLSSVDEEQQLRALAERMGQLSVHEDPEEVAGKNVCMSGEDKHNKQRQ